MASVLEREKFSFSQEIGRHPHSEMDFEKGSGYFFKWDQFGSHMASYVGQLQALSQFRDVWLVCQGEIITAHKIVLAMNSSFFKSIFQEVKDTKCDIFIEGMSYKIVQKIVQYLYMGEVTLDNEQISEFVEALSYFGINCSLEDSYRKVKENVIEEKALNDPGPMPVHVQRVNTQEYSCGKENCDCYMEQPFQKQFSLESEQTGKQEGENPGVLVVQRESILRLNPSLKSPSPPRAKEPLPMKKRYHREMLMSLGMDPGEESRREVNAKLFSPDGASCVGVGNSESSNSSNYTNSMDDSNSVNASYHPPPRGRVGGFMSEGSVLPPPEYPFRKRYLSMDSHTNSSFRPDELPLLLYENPQYSARKSYQTPIDFHLQLSSSKFSCSSGVYSITTSDISSPTASTGSNPGSIPFPPSSSPQPKTKEIRSAQVPKNYRFTAKQVDQMVDSVSRMEGNMVPCTICQKMVKRERLRAHIHECHLLTGRKIVCPHCGLSLRSKGSYRVHLWRHKRGTLPPPPESNVNNGSII